MATTKMIDSPLAVSTQLIRIELLITPLETTPRVETGTPPSCSILAIVNVSLRVRGAGFSGVAVNALSKVRAPTFRARPSNFDRHKDESFGEAREAKRGRRAAERMCELTGKCPVDARELPKFTMSGLCRCNAA